MKALRRGDWLGLALVWLDVAAHCIEQAERAYARSLAERDQRYERARDALLERLRGERHVLRTERAILVGLARERDMDPPQGIVGDAA